VQDHPGIPFNKPFLSGRELDYIGQAVRNGRLSGNGPFTQKCQLFFRERWRFNTSLLTTSCTDALEMAAILLDIQPGDEVIVPSFTFVSTANAFVLRGATIIFADSLAENPNLDVSALEALITPRTRAIVPVHYGGMACDMDPLIALARRHHIHIVEDAAQAINASYKGKALGSCGDLAAFSFHETKNIIAGEGGMLVVNNPEFAERAEIIWEKGTNRAAFFRGEADKYHWVDIGSSFLPSELTAAFLWAQLENLEKIQARRLGQWNRYRNRLSAWAQDQGVQIPQPSLHSSGNGHLFYLVFNTLQRRTQLIDMLRRHRISALFHYQSLHRSPFYHNRHDGRSLPQAERYSDGLVRLPLFYELGDDKIDYICDLIVSQG